VLALDDGALARIAIASTRMPASTRDVFLKSFAAAADPPKPRPRSDLSDGSIQPPGRRPRAGRRSPAAAKQARYRERLRRGVAYVPLPVTRLILDYLVRGGLLPRDREAADRVDIGLAAAAALERAAEANR
jgi:hypothetical protein